MKVISFDRLAHLDIRYGNNEGCQLTYHPGERYLIDDVLAGFVKEGMFKSFSPEFVDAPKLERPKDLKGKRVVIHCAWGGLGDQLMLSPIPKYLKEVVGAEVYIWASSPYHATLWTWHPSISANEAVMMPIHWNAMYGDKPFYDHLFIFEDIHGLPPIDMIYLKWGFDPHKIDPQYKRPFFSSQKADKIAALEWLEKNEVKGEYILFQASATRRERQFSPQMVERILKCLDKFELPIICTNDCPLPKDVEDVISAHPMAINAATRIPRARTYAALIEESKFLVGPDSSGIHFAAAFSKPALGLWGCFPPHTRTMHYENQVHLFHRELWDATWTEEQMEQNSWTIQDAITEEEIEDGLNQLKL